jgi:hypothetical protein
LKRDNFIWLLLALLAASVWAEDATAPTPKKKLTLQDLLRASTGTYSHSTTVAGVRGLEETNAGVDTKARDFAAIDRLDKNVVSPLELVKFMSEGKLK